MKQAKIGYALCGSFCTFDKSIDTVKALLAHGWEVTPIMSENAYATDTRFGKAADFISTLQDICRKDVIHTIVQAEPIGPKKLFDAIVVAPCTGNTLAKLANSITDTSVTMAVKAHIRNAKPAVIAVSTNDALAGCAKNIGTLMALRNYYFVPMRQDNPEGKPRSVVADFSLLPDAIEKAIGGEQIQPILTSI